MMRKFLVLLLTLWSASSCEKVKQAAQQAMSAVSQGLRDKKEEPKVSVDTSLQELVDQTDRGVVFRRDLPFPEKIEVKTTIERKFSGRFFHASQLGKKVEVIKGTESVTAQLERKGNVVSYALKESSFNIPSAQNPGSGSKLRNPFREQPVSTDRVAFRKSGGAWKLVNSGDFRKMVLAQQLNPVFQELLVEQALEPRPLWFAKRRIQIGDEVNVDGSAIAMLVAGKAKGHLNIKLVEIEAVHGHPCGVFSVTGDYSRNEFPDLEGVLTDEVVTVESGKLWLSLLYPVILKQELNTIQTFKPGGDGGLIGRGQGTVEVKVDREWKILDAGGSGSKSG